MQKLVTNKLLGNVLRPPTNMPLLSIDILMTHTNFKGIENNTNKV